MQKKKKKRKYLLYTVAMKIKWVTEGTSSLPIVWLLPLCQIKGKKELTSLYNAPARLNPSSKVANDKLWFLQDSRSNLTNTASKISSFLMKLKLYKMSKLKTKFCVLFKTLRMLIWMTSNLWFFFFFFCKHQGVPFIGTYLHFPVHKEENICTKRPMWNSVHDRGPVLKTRDI